jgi:hypothetical protein
MSNTATSEPINLSALAGLRPDHLSHCDVIQGMLSSVVQVEDGQIAIIEGVQVYVPEGMDLGTPGRAVGILRIGREYYLREIGEAAT